MLAYDFAIELMPVRDILQFVAKYLQEPLQKEPQHGFWPSKLVMQY